MSAPPSAKRRVAGLTLSDEQASVIAEVVSSCAGLSRHEISATICELFGWQRPSGRLKTREARDLLEALEAAGRLRLPTKRGGRPLGAMTRTSSGVTERHEGPLRSALRDVAPVTVDVVTATEHELWRGLVQRHHPLGYRTPFGASLRYMIRVTKPQPRIVGCLQFSSPAWRIAVRDRWVGWTDDQRTRQLQHIVNQSRFLILPNIDVPNLASHTLAQCERRLPMHWEERFGLRPWLLETLVSPPYSGTCYRAANWLYLGMTSGRGRMDTKHLRHGRTPKHVFVRPLQPSARRRLRQGI